jgi:protein-S-isoprenylcysteine O-methyltransferase Ste14
MRRRYSTGRAISWRCRLGSQACSSRSAAISISVSATPIAAPTLVTGGLYRFSRNPQYTASIIGLVGLSIGANSILTIIMSVVMSGAYVMMALVEEDWLKQLYGAPYRDYCRETSRFLDVQGLITLIERKKPSRQAG